jgi:predicted N-acetyltransferase YhbS
VADPVLLDGGDRRIGRETFRVRLRRGDLEAADRVLEDRPGAARRLNPVDRVAVVGDRVVSTATLLDETLTLAGVPIAAGQVELVATDRAYEGRGLVRALMGWAHERSARRGHLAQVMIGIPYFYRRFGYQYSIVLPQARAVHAVPPPPTGTSCARPAPTTSPRWTTSRPGPNSGTT